MTEAWQQEFARDFIDAPHVLAMAILWFLCVRGGREDSRRDRARHSGTALQFELK